VISWFQSVCSKFTTLVPLQQGPDSALQLLRVLLYVPHTQTLLSRLPSVAKVGAVQAERG
jgi:hypothetical protein